MLPGGAPHDDPSPSRKRFGRRRCYRCRARSLQFSCGLLVPDGCDHGSRGGVVQPRFYTAIRGRRLLPLRGPLRSDPTRERTAGVSGRDLLRFCLPWRRAVRRSGPLGLLFAHRLRATCRRGLLGAPPLGYRSVYPPRRPVIERPALILEHTKDALNGSLAHQLVQVHHEGRNGRIDFRLDTHRHLASHRSVVGVNACVRCAGAGCHARRILPLQAFLLRRLGRSPVRRAEGAAGRLDRAGLRLALGERGLLRLCAGRALA
jgi:hypothetical protein